MDKRRKEQGNDLREAGTMLSETDVLPSELESETLDVVEAFYGW
ncbi:hypothetical protein LCGC14_2879160 [marine sediment metagenome]|uniref:Uncharacterized protein n=1 Tax=marine sediment metagenome TaxID=412755 RepID=A0A0F8Y0L5_9ZZZZ